MIFERKCVMCGTVFPHGTPASRKYCDDCLKIRHIEAQRRHKEKREVQKQQEPVPDPQAEKRKADARYCAKCVYHGKLSGVIICDYISMVGKRRGCKAGVGCVMREFPSDSKTSVQYRHCERCGSRFLGLQSAHLCMACRKEALRANQRHMMEVKRQRQEEKAEKENGDASQ